MADFEPGTLVRVPFPYTDRPVLQRRPALVLSSAEFNRRHGLLWVAMVTSTGNASWDGDVVIPDFQAASLPAPSLVRTAKLATIQSGDATTLGHVDAETLDRIRQAVLRVLGGSRV